MLHLVRLREEVSSCSVEIKTKCKNESELCEFDDYILVDRFDEWPSRRVVIVVVIEQRGPWKFQRVMASRPLSDTLRRRDAPRSNNNVGQRLVRHRIQQASGRNC